MMNVVCWMGKFCALTPGCALSCSSWLNGTKSTMSSSPPCSFSTRVLSSGMYSMRTSSTAGQIERDLHIVGRERRAVGELDAGAQRKGPGQPIRGRVPFGRQCGLDVGAVFGHADEPVVDVGKREQRGVVVDQPGHKDSGLGVTRHLQHDRRLGGGRGGCRLRPGGRGGRGGGRRLGCRGRGRATRGDEQRRAKRLGEQTQPSSVACKHGVSFGYLKLAELDLRRGIVLGWVLGRPESILKAAWQASSRRWRMATQRCRSSSVTTTR